MSDNKKNYLATVTSLYRMGGSNGYTSLKIDEKVFEALQNARIGGKLVLNMLTDEQRERIENKTGKRAPHGFINYKTPEQVEAEFAEYQSRREGESVV